MTSHRSALGALIAVLASILTANAADLTTSVDRSKGSAPYQAQVAKYLDKELAKIVGGQPASAGQLPWQVSLGVSWIASPADAHFCGGTVYNENWIVTASHCVDGNSPEDIIVTAGTIDLAKGGQRRNVSRILMHSDYVSADKGHDIALLELVDQLVLDKSTTSPLGLLSPDDEAAALANGATVLTSGFGYTSEGGQVSSTLNFVEIPVVDNPTCNDPLSYDGAITDDMICAGNPTGGQDSCQGDSGGPLVSNPSSDPKLAGVVSWGEGCARPLKFGVYSRVPTYVSWVEACVNGDMALCTIR